MKKCATADASLLGVSKCSRERSSTMLTICPLAPCCGRQGLLPLVMFSEAMIFMLYG